MSAHSFHATFVALVCACAYVPAVVLAAPSPAPSPSPSPSAAAAPADPCVSLSNLVSRPSFTTSACAVKPGDLLIESGYANTTSGSSGLGTVSIPQALVRAGIAKNFEVDFAAPSHEQQSTTPTTSGESDSGVGFKYEIGYTSKLTYGVNALYTLDSGSPALSANGNGILANANGAFALSPALGLFGSLGYNAQSSGTPIVQQRYHGFDPSFGASLALPIDLNAYVEGFGMSAFAPGSSGMYGFDAGFTKDIGSRLQLDVEYYGYPRLHDGAREASIGFGAAYLFGP